MTKVFNMYLPDNFIDHALPQEQYQSIGMDAFGIEKKVFELIKSNNSEYVESRTIISE